jgi:exonuclease V gamma subunit
LLRNEHPWSHDAAALAVARELGQEPDGNEQAANIAPPQNQGVGEVIQLEWLAQFMHDPLWPYVRKTLGINPWRDNDLSIPSTIPLTLDKLEKRQLRDAYIERLLEAEDRNAFAQSWADAVRQNGEVPVLGFDQETIAEIQQFSAALVELAETENVPLTQRNVRMIEVDAGGPILKGRIERCYPDADNVHSIVFVEPDAIKPDERKFRIAKALAGLSLLSLKASNVEGDVRALILSQHKDWKPVIDGDPAAAANVVQIRIVRLEESINSDVASWMLTRLVQLYRQAATKPYGMFGKTTEKLVAGDQPSALEAFTSFTTDGLFLNTNEAVVFGVQSTFADVFGEPEQERYDEYINFYQQFKALTRFTYKRPAYIYNHAPNAPA